MQNIGDKVRGTVLTDWVIIEAGAVVCGAGDNYNELTLGDYELLIFIHWIISGLIWRSDDMKSLNP